MIAALVAAAALAPPPCAIEQAIYVLHGAPQFTAGFERVGGHPTGPSDLVFWLRTPARTYRFDMSSPNGYGGTFLRPRGTGQGPEIAFDAFDDNLAALPYPPTSDTPAPARLFARGLGEALWYRPAELAGGDRRARQESMPVGMFEPSGCRPSVR